MTSQRGIANKTDKYRWYRDLDVETRFYFFRVNARSRGATIPVTWANVTSDTGRFFDSRLSNMRRAAIRRAGASRPYNHGGIETDTLLLNCKKISSIRALSIARAARRPTKQIRLFSSFWSLNGIRYYFKCLLRFQISNQMWFSHFWTLYIRLEC